jgi:Tol biopolymer transport system component
VAYLGASGETIGFGWAEPAAGEGPVARTIRRGNPFYVSWAPDGDRLLVHVGEDQLGRLGLDGELLDLGEAPGLFHAPVWLPDDRLVYVTGGSERQALVIRDGARTRVVHRFRGAMEFVVSPDGRQIAYRVDVGETVGPVAVLDVGSRRSRVIADVVAAAFQWSPDGRRLLILGQALDASTPDAPTGRWYVWDGRTTTPVGVPFFPSPRYVRDYLPFFGQYTQTMTLWSPDGRSFAFPALIGDRDGIWVQDLDEAEPSLVLEDGSIVAWSPVDL